MSRRFLTVIFLAFLIFPTSSAWLASESCAEIPSSLPGEWRTKSNATMEKPHEIAIPDDNAVRLRSNFGRDRFTWLQWVPDMPLDLRNADCLRLRLCGHYEKGDGDTVDHQNGDEPRGVHRIFVRLLIPEAATSDSSVIPSGFRYYDNRRESVTLDPNTMSDDIPHEVTLSLTEFVTPVGGDRMTDLSRIARVELMVRVDGIAMPLDLVATPPIPDHWNESELSAQKEVVAESARLTESLRPRIAALENSEAAQGTTNTDFFLKAIWRWCVDDLNRSIAAGDLPTLRFAERKTTELEHLALHTNIGNTSDIDKNTISITDEYHHNKNNDIKVNIDQTIDWEHNPFVEHPLRATQRDFMDAVEPLPDYPRSFPVGEIGFHAVMEPWDFRRYAEEAAVLAWCVTEPGSPLQDAQALAEPLLSRLQLLATQHLDGDYGAGRSSARGYDPNGNRFALAAALQAWNRWCQAYPDRLPTPWRDEIDAGLRQIVDAQVAEYGRGRVSQLTKRSSESFELLTQQELINVGYANIDAVYLRILDLAMQRWPTDTAMETWQTERQVFRKILAAAMLPDGGFRYLADENDCPLYHDVVIIHMAAILRDRIADESCEPAGDNFDSGWESAWEAELIRQTEAYYPLAFEPSGLAEYTTAPTWKRYWNRGDAAAPAIVAGMCDDARNQAVSEACAEVWGYGKGFYAITAVGFWQPIEPQPMLSQRVVEDNNIGGLRGRSGRMSWVAGGRDANNGVSRTSVNASKSEIDYHVFQNNAADTSLPTPFRVGMIKSDPERRPLPLDAVVEFETNPDNKDLVVSQHWKFEGVTATGTIRIVQTLSPGPADDGERNDARDVICGVLRFGFDKTLETIAENQWRYGEIEVRLIPDGDDPDHPAVRPKVRTLSTWAKNRNIGKSTEIVLEKGIPSETGAYSFTLEIRGAQ